MRVKKGGFVKGEEFAYEQEINTEHSSTVIWGSLLYDAHDTKLTRKRKDRPPHYAWFTMKHMMGSAVRVNVFRDENNIRLAARLKRGDRVLVAGEIVKKIHYIDGFAKDFVYVDAFMIIPYKAIVALEELYSAGRLDSLLEDKTESAGDYGFQNNQSV